MRQNDGVAVPAPLRQAIDANVDLKQALQRSQMPVRFQAMVLGLTALKQANAAKHDASNPR